MVNCIDISPDDQWVVSGGEDGSLLIFDVNSGDCVKSIDIYNSKAIYVVKFNPEEL